MIQKVIKTLWPLCFLFFSHLRAYELAIAAQFRDEAPYLKEWVEYHKMVGVDHFWLYNNSSIDAWEEVLKSYIEEGLVEVIDWPSLPSDFQGNHTKANQDALYRARGKTEWIALIDLDEFLLPMKEKTVVDCLQKHYSEADAIYASWRMFGTGGIYLNPGEPILTKLVASSFKYHPRNAVGKSLLRPDKVDIERIWYEHYMPLLPGNRGYYNGNGENMDFDGTTFLTVPFHCDKYLRINHYNLRDENFFQNVRMAKAEKGIYGEPKLFKEHHEAFSMIKDYAIVQLIQKKHPQMYEAFWKNH